jgi:phytoene desaturase (3,4-didehydrolycopene-forming)
MYVYRQRSRRFEVEATLRCAGKEKFNLTHGSILGITHDFFNVLAFRHQARHPRLNGAYFVGASAHPGTGVPIALAGSRLCTEAILSDLSIPLPESYDAKSARPKHALDLQHRRSLLYCVEDIIRVLFPYVLGAIVATTLGLAWACSTDSLHFSPPSPALAMSKSRLPGFDLDLSMPLLLSGAVVTLSLLFGARKMP